MSTLFIRLLNEAIKLGWLNEANLFSTGEFSAFEIETESGTFRVSITKKDEVEKDA